MTTIAIKANKDINLDNIQAEGEAPKVNLEPGTYALPNDSNRQILFVDPEVDHVADLLESVTANTDIIHLQSGAPALEQMATALAGKSDVSEIHLLAHGEPGSLSLAGTRLDTAALNADPSSLFVISAALGKGAKLALWACSVGAGTVGRAFKETLEAATGAHVFAASGLVGASVLGGTWAIGTKAPFSQPAMAAYGHTLPTFDGNGGEVSGNIATEADNGDGITLRIEFTDDDPDSEDTSTASNIDGAGYGGTIGLLYYNSATNTSALTTVSFSSPVTVTSFQFADADGGVSGTHTFTPVGGSGTTITVEAAAFDTPFPDARGLTVTPSDWVGVTGYTITNSEGAFSPVLDTIVYTVYTAPPQQRIDDKPVFKSGGDNDDKISGAAGNDTLIGGEGNDFVEGGDGSDILFGGTGDDIIYTTEKDNENGDFSTNTAWGGEGNDTLYGGLGGDALGGGTGEDALHGGRGADILYGGANDDDLNGGAGEDTIFGGTSNDIVDGGADNDLLFNGAGDDIADGGSGDDILWGGAGDDTLTGGDGSDIFSFTATSGNDIITDFDTDSDQLNLSELDLADNFDLASIASEITEGESSGILLTLTEGSSFFLVGLSLSDLSSIDFTV